MKIVFTHAFMYDIIIIGAGPAGATFARLISSSYRVLLIDGGTPKPCGGLLSPSAQAIITRLGISVPHDVFVRPQPFSVRAVDFKSNLSYSFQRHYLNIDRDRFDDWLRSLVPGSIEMIRPARYVSSEISPDGKSVKVRFSHDNSIEEAECRVLLAADGPSSAVRREFVPNHPKRKTYTSVQEWFETDRTFTEYGAFFDPDVNDYYSWTIPKGNLLVLGTAVPLGIPFRPRYEMLKKKLREHGFQLGDPVKRESSLILRPLSKSALCSVCKKSNVYQPLAFIGEAGAWISPSSSEGISFAMRTALALAKSLEPGLEGFQKRYEKLLRPLYREIFVRNLKSIPMYVPWIRKRIFKSELFSLDMPDETERDA